MIRFDSLSQAKQSFFVDKKGEDDVSYISEEEALQKIHHLSIPKRSLREYCIDEGKAERTQSGKAFLYKYRRDFIEDLSVNWITKEMIMKKMNFSKWTLYRRMEKENWQTMRIGQTLLIHAGSILRMRS